MNDSGFRIEELFVLQGAIVLVFYNHGKCYQFRILTYDGSVQENQYIFYTREAASLAAKQLLISG